MMNDSTAGRMHTNKWSVLLLSLATIAAPGCAAAPPDGEAVDANINELGRASEDSRPELLCFTQGLGACDPQAPPSYDETGELDFEGSSIQTRAVLGHSYVAAAGYQRVRMRFAYATQEVGANDWRRRPTSA